MGSAIRYKCVECGYETGMLIGASGNKPTTRTPYVCEPTKDVVIVNGILGKKKTLYQNVRSVRTIF